MNKKFVIFLIVISALFVTGIVLFRPHGHNAVDLRDTGRDIYYCPMHPAFTSDKPGSCGICGMDLVKQDKKAAAPAQEGERKIIYYRNPMKPQVTSPVPMKDQMGMDYIPVYEEEQNESSGIWIDAERQQYIGVKKEPIGKVKLVKEISTVGRVAYDPQIYVAQQEYLEALGAREKIKDSDAGLIAEQMDALVEAAQRRLLLLGLSRQQIEDLAKGQRADVSLFLPQEEEALWIYLTIYEHEIGFIRAGQQVEVDSVAYPGEVFPGEIVSMAPVLNAETRSINVRAKIKNDANKLKPEMFVNVKIKVDLGEKLAVPQDAVMDTGKRRVVFIAKDDGYFVARQVKLGQSAGGYYEILDGLSEGDIVVTSGNFFIDSESKLKAAISGTSHQHGE